MAQIQKQWSQVEISLRGDGGFCRDARSWCEDHRVGYVFGLAKNKRLVNRSVDHRGAAINRFSPASVPLTFDYLAQFGVTV